MIEDIDYLKKNSEVDSIAFFADSSDRDRKVYPLSAEFAIEFTQPFRNVVGFDILDAAIPTTMYNVDLYNYTLEFSIVKSADVETITAIDITDSIRGCTRFSEIFEDSRESNLVVVPYGIAFTLLENQVTWTKYMCAVKRLLIDSVVERTTAVPSSVVDWGAYHYFSVKGQYYRVLKEDPNLAEILKGDVDVQTSPTTGEIVIYTYEFSYISVEEYTRLTVSPGTYIGTIRSLRPAVELGNYDISALKTELNIRLNGYGIYVESTTLTDTKQGKYKFICYDYTLFNANKRDTLAKNIGFDLHPSLEDSTKYSFKIVGANERVYTPLYDSVQMTYALVAPGIVNLTGERFIILRCKEIEDHLYGSFSYSKHIPGIAMFKMGAITDISNLRFDYVSLVRKPFHPIGKMTKLTFRFETSSGRLYDFKGVNNQMLMMIKFLVPTPKMDFKYSILNPNYESDFIKYMYDKREIANREDSGDEQEFDTRINYIEYKKKLAEYDFSSSEEDDESGASSEISVQTKSFRRPQTLLGRLE
jgi:hypothetical protein